MYSNNRNLPITKYLEIPTIRRKTAKGSLLKPANSITKYIYRKKSKMLTYKPESTATIIFV